MASPRDIEFERNRLGLFVPVHADAPDPRMAHFKTYLTYTDLTGHPVPMAKIPELLAPLSAADCFARLARIGCRLYRSTDPDEVIQSQLVYELSGDGPTGNLLQEKLRDPRFTAVFFEQQLVHLARLVALHAAEHPHDDFDGLSRYDDFMVCLLGVTDHLEEGLDLDDEDQRRSWEVRQAELNGSEDPLPLFALHHEVYSVLWPAMNSTRAQEANESFQRFVGMTIDEYFTVGSAVVAYFINSGRNGELRAPLDPERYFSSARMAPEVWRSFFRLNARKVDGLRDELLNEESQYGSTAFGSLTFERFPLVEVEDGLYLPLSMSSLTRRITQGVSHLLSEAAVEDKRDRRRHSSAFGNVFQQSVEQTVRRGMALAAPQVPITADIPYDGPKGRRNSTDVILGQGRDPVFIEVVSGPLQAATITRGDLGTLDADIDRLVVEKTEQLDQCIDDFFKRRLTVEGSDPANLNRVWPVVLTSHSFPHSEYVIAYVEERVRSAGYLRDERIGPLAIVSAEDLFFCEGFMQQGQSVLSLIRGWKSGPSAAVPFKNFLIAHGGGRAPGSDHFERRFAEANANHMQRLLGSDVTADDLLKARDNRDDQ